MSTEFAQAALLLAARVPPGNVLSYGDIAELLDAGGPRQVGAALAHSAGTVPWWRIVRADGTLPPPLHESALSHWQAEGTPLHRGRVSMAAARWQPLDADFAAIDALAAALRTTARRAPGPNRRMPLL